MRTVPESLAFCNCTCAKSGARCASAVMFMACSIRAFVPSPPRDEVFMDPQVTWNEMVEAAAARDWVTARERAEALLAWLAKRGATTHNQPAAQLAEKLAS